MISLLNKYTNNNKNVSVEYDGSIVMLNTKKTEKTV